jgi:general L-amino acid transport system substrate-binding protein
MAWLADGRRPGVWERPRGGRSGTDVVDWPSMLVRLGLAALVVALTGTLSAAPQSSGGLSVIRARGHLACGLEPDIPGFAYVDPSGRYRGFEVDICRAVAAAIFGSPDKVTFVRALSVAEFLRRTDIDVVARRITWELRREGEYGLTFGPVTFYDGQSFLVARSLGVSRPSQLLGREVCVSTGTVAEVNLDAYAAAHKLAIRKVPVGDPHVIGEIADALSSRRCTIYTSDVSLLGAIRSLLPRDAGFDILPGLISKEPLAPLMRQSDTQLAGVVRWTIFALIAAEELGITAANVEEMRKSTDRDVQRLLGIMPGNGKALGLDEDWAYQAIKAVGNYGEVFEKHVGRDSALRLDRGLNRLYTDGGLMVAPPLR